MWCSFLYSTFRTYIEYSDQKQSIAEKDTVKTRFRCVFSEYRGRIFGRKSPPLTDFALPPLSKSSLKLDCNVNIVNGNLKGENSTKLYVHEFSFSLPIKNSKINEGKLTSYPLPTAKWAKKVWLFFSMWEFTKWAKGKEEGGREGWWAKQKEP